MYCASVSIRKAVYSHLPSTAYSLGDGFTMRWVRPGRQACSQIAMFLLCHELGNLQNAIHLAILTRIASQR